MYLFDCFLIVHSLFSILLFIVLCLFRSFDRSTDVRFLFGIPSNISLVFCVVIKENCAD